MSFAGGFVEYTSAAYPSIFSPLTQFSLFIGNLFFFLYLFFADNNAKSGRDVNCIRELADE